MIEKLLSIGFTLTDADEANTQYTNGLIDVFIQSDGKVILAYNSNEIVSVKDNIHLTKLVEALNY